MSSFVNSVVATFNNLISYNNTSIIVIFDEYNKIWFSLSNIYKALGYADIAKEIKRADIDSDYIKTYGEIYDNLPKNTSILQNQRISNLI